MSQITSNTNAQVAESPELLRIDGAAFAALAEGIVEDCLADIIHRTIVDIHRSEKTLRMQSAATIASKAALAQAGTDTTSSASGAKNAPSVAPAVRVETAGAVYDHGTVYLTGNPLETTPEIMCATCKLPRLHFPIAGAGSQQPDLSRKYCGRQPFVSQPGHDCHGVPFPTDTIRPKKERELLKQEKKNEKTSNLSSQDGGPGDAAPNSNLALLDRLGTTSKGANYFPWLGCPFCKRSVQSYRIAQHAERCIGMSGRSSNRTALEKKAQGTAGSNTPFGSRVGTPAPGSQVLSGDVNGTAAKADNGDEDTPKKKKKGGYVKKADRERMAAAGKDELESGKRGRDDGTDDSPRKKSKVDEGD